MAANDNAQVLARRVLQRVKGQGAQFELPTPTLSELWDWFALLRHDAAEYVRYTHMPLTPPHPYMIDNYNSYLKCRRYIEESVLENEGNPQDYTSDLDPLELSHSEWLELKRKVNRWRPEASAKASNGETVYHLTGKDGRWIYLTYENDQWIRHDGFPYSVFKGNP